VPGGAVTRRLDALYRAYLASPDAGHAALPASI